MELPNYFLADLPDQSALNPGLISEACKNLKRNRERFLVQRPAEEIIRTIATVAKEWLDRDFPIRTKVLEEGPQQTGFTRETIVAGLTAFFGQITKESLEGLVIQDVGKVRRLDGIVPDENQAPNGRSAMVLGPELIVHFTGGVLPNPVLTSMVLGLLTKSA
jgi:hypothetical protein